MNQCSFSPSLFWVCIIALCNHRYKVCLMTDLKDVFRHLLPAEDNRLLYMRDFQSMQEAIGHKLFLESVSLQTLELNIRCLNPLGKDLAKLLALYFDCDGSQPLEAGREGGQFVEEAPAEGFKEWIVEGTAGG